jgi:hypothetical protein
MNCLIYTALVVSIEAYCLSSCRGPVGWTQRHPQRIISNDAPLSRRRLQLPHHDGEVDDTEMENNASLSKSRRSFVTDSLIGSSLLAASTFFPQSTVASIGTLPEYADTNNILQGISIRVADQSQQKAMIAFLEDGFDCEVLRKRIVGSVEETWLGFGPEQLRIPDDFQIPVSSFAKYGGHASVHLIYDAKETTPYYRIGDGVPGNNIAYLQMGVPAYRISQMVKNGGNIMDAYGYVNVVSPSGLPIRGIVGISPDPIMFIAINCIDVKQSQKFYEKLGFVEQPYPYCRPNQGLGQFEPIQPEKSVYMAPPANGMGVLLLKSKEKKIIPNPAIQSLHVVYNPSSDTTDSTTDTTTVSSNSGTNENENDTAIIPTRIVDPSGVTIQFQSVVDFEREESVTR